MITKLTPVIEYPSVPEALPFYTEKLGFEAFITEGDPIHMAFVRRDNAELQLTTCQSEKIPYAPLFRVMVDNVREIHAEIKDRAPDILHPNLPEPTDRPWGCTEFAVLDPHTIGFVFFTPTSNLS